MGAHHLLLKLTTVTVNMIGNHTDNYKMANDLMCINENYLYRIRFTQRDTCALHCNNEIRVIADKN